MAKNHSGDKISALDRDTRIAFRKAVVEKRIAEREWRMHARMLAREFTELDETDPDILDGIAGK